MNIENHQVVLYPRNDGAWLPEIPVIEGCYVLMPTIAEPLDEPRGVFAMIAEERNEK